MSRNFALLKIVGKEDEYFQGESARSAPGLAAIAPPPVLPKPFRKDALDQVLSDGRELRFELEAWQLAELTKLVQGIFLTPEIGSGGAAANRVVVLASSESGNGCTWICARAAELLASQVAGRVCLVDANFLNPALHEHFGVPNHHGLAEALRQQDSIGGYIGQLSRRNLALVSAGADYSSSLADRDLASEQMRQRLQQLRAEFDYVLIDGASLDVGDTSIGLAGMADGIVLVLKSHTTRKERTRSRVHDLKSAGVRILGAVLNQPA